MQYRQSWMTIFASTTFAALAVPVTVAIAVAVAAFTIDVVMSSVSTDVSAVVAALRVAWWIGRALVAAAGAARHRL